MTRSCSASLFCERVVLGHLVREARTGNRVLTQSARLLPMKLQEETLTEDMLVRAEGRFPDIVEVVLFDRLVEGRYTGADWIWWFDTPAGPRAMLVQAKRPEEHMSAAGSTWTIRLSNRANKFTRLNQHATLLKAATLLRVSPYYAIYAPTLRTPNCQNITNMALWSSLWPFQGAFPATLATILFVPAATFQVGSNALDPLRPPGESLGHLICCRYQGLQTSMTAAESADDPDLVTPDDSFERLISRIVERLSDGERPDADPVRRSVAGVVRFSCLAG